MIMSYYEEHREKIQANQKKYRNTKQGKEAHRRALKKYRKTEKGKNGRRKYYKRPIGRLMITFTDIKERCNNPNHKSYKHYGGRGIKCLFKSYPEFRNYVFNELQITIDLLKGLEIDRINNSGNYEPGNIRFVTHKENCLNTRRNREPTTDQN